MPSDEANRPVQVQRAALPGDRAAVSVAWKGYFSERG
jgi:hypothetical protein